MIRHARLSDIQQIRYLAQTQSAPYAQGTGGKREPLPDDFRTMVEEEQVSVFVIENAIGGFVLFVEKVRADSCWIMWTVRGSGRIAVG